MARAPTSRNYIICEHQATVNYGFIGARATKELSRANLATLNNLDLFPTLSGEFQRQGTGSGIRKIRELCRGATPFG